MVSARLLSSVAIWASAAATLARATSISSLRAPDCSRASALLGDAHPALRGRQAVPRDVPPRRGIIALLARARVAGQQGFEALQVLLGGGELGLRGRDVGLCGGDLRFGLPDVLGPGAGEDQSKVGLGLLAVGAGALERQLHIARVEGEDLLAHLHAVTLANREGEDAAAGVGREPGFGGLDVPGDAERVGGWGLVAAGQQEKRESRER